MLLIGGLAARARAAAGRVAQGARNIVNRVRGGGRRGQNVSGSPPGG